MKNFIGRRRYAVFDLSAGPVIYGPLKGELSEIENVGIVSENSRPPFTNRNNVSTVMEMSYMIHIISTSLSFVFFPDLEFTLKSSGDSNQQLQEVVIPILAFRNHNQISLFEKTKDNQDYWIDIEKIRASLQPLEQFLEIKISIVTGSHSLHDHKHIAMAFEKSLNHKILFDQT